MSTPASDPTGPHQGVTRGPAAESPQEKAQFREDWRGRRRALSPQVRAQESADLTEHLLEWYLPRAVHRRAAVVMSYGTEPDTASLRERLHGAGVEVLVPVTEPGRQLSWVRWRPGVEMGRSPVAPIDEPRGERLPSSTMQSVDLVVVPALTVGRDGYRMGQGGGYYDRFLEGLRLDRERTGHGPATMSSVFTHELLPVGEVPVGPLDQPVDAAVTADGIHWVQ